MPYNKSLINFVCSVFIAQTEKPGRSILPVQISHSVDKSLIVHIIKSRICWTASTTIRFLSKLLTTLHIWKKTALRASCMKFYTVMNFPLQQLRINKLVSMTKQVKT